MMNILNETAPVTVSPQFRHNPFVRPDMGAPRPAAPGEYRVIIVDNDTNTYEEVIRVCMLALGIDYEDGYQIALAVDHNGYCAVYEGPEPEATEIADVIRMIGIEVRVIPAAADA